MDVATNAIDLRIDEIVVEGFGNLDPAALQHAIQSELTRVLSGPGSLRPLTDATTMNTSMTVAPGSDVTAIGAEIARSIAGGLRQ